jgi:transcriptional regulator with XRE-family HTH domain
LKYFFIYFGFFVYRSEKRGIVSASRNVFRYFDLKLWRVIDVLFLGSRLREMRDKRGLSAVDLDRLSGVGQGNISEYENGKKQPRQATVKKLCTALGIEDERYFYDMDMRTPLEVLPEMPEDIEKFIMNLESMPYLKVSEKAKKEGIPAEALDRLVEALRIAKQ